MRRQQLANPIVAWSTIDISRSLMDGAFDTTKDFEISVVRLDAQKRVFLGIDFEGYLVFGCEQLGDISGFKFPRVKLEVNKTFNLSNGVVIERCFALKFIASNEDEILSISGIFSGLFTLVNESENSSAATLAAQAYESYFSDIGKIKVSKSLEIGLFGELVSIYALENCKNMVDSWHSTPDATYDFSFSSNRLEVKTSTRPTRIHWLRSSQLFSTSDPKLKYLSIYAPEDAAGVSVKQLIQLIIDKLEDTNSINNFLEKMDMYEYESLERKFDLQTAATTLKFIDSTDVPFPEYSNPKILEVQWKCNFNDLSSSVNSTPWA
jgi:hypothetical protein